MGIVGIILATMAATGSLIYAVFWQTPVAEALALMICGGLLTAALAWYFRPQSPVREKCRHWMSRHRHSH
jgi:ABC-type enterobactin transport system permease subunit